ncbi:unnamed protein product [Rotaria magnacalcarata]|uniref:MULE transposase domain-containing protein n=2 Tax=Rotaria magnacalcarata TaxID=392030 RepID=A0A815K6Q5_9BILA|nr:unnamed protein product [Rotaria magnacalcarata]CAF3889670.1 unnamed protein product [Rotaria magnacalcarata]
MAEAFVILIGEIQAKSPAISFMNSNKGKPLLVADEYTFKLNKTTTTTKYWICTINGCAAKVHTDSTNLLMKTVGNHNHLPEKEKIEAREVREKIKQRAINETTPIPRIYDEECAKAMLSTTAIAILPSEREMNSGINKARRAITPIIPTTQLFDIPEYYSKTLNKNEFLITGKMVTRRQRILLFSTSEQLKMLFAAETIFMDDTFSIFPSMFDQVYKIHAIKYDQSCPCVFGLLPNRQKNTYHFMFQELKAIAAQMKMNFSPKLIMSDFEAGLLSVVALEFVTTTSLSCYFHFTQAIYRAIQRVGLSTAYNNDDDIKKYCRQLMALPLIPEAIIEDTYDELIATIPSTLKETLKDLLQYFQEQWLNKVSISQWCVHGLNIRTNNNAEGDLFLLLNSEFYLVILHLAFHSRFNRRVQINHPNIWSFIKLLQGEENRFHHMYVQFIAGLGTRSKQAKTVAIQRRIDKLGERYYDGAINAMEYLDGLSFIVAKRKK